MYGRQRFREAKKGATLFNKEIVKTLVFFPSNGLASAERFRICYHSEQNYYHSEHLRRENSIKRVGSVFCTFKYGASRKSNPRVGLKKPIMKIFKTILIVTTVLFTTISFQSCKDACDDVVCQNGGTCDEGICDCAVGFEGTSCATLSRDKFIGSYSVAENCGSYTDAYDSNIAISSLNDLSIGITNLFDWYENPVIGTMTSATTFVINAQDPDNDLPISGSGEINSAGLVIVTFAVGDASTGMLDCTANFTLK